MSKFQRNIIAKTLSLFSFILISNACYCQNDSDYFRFLDSAEIHIEDNSKKTLAFLDSIPLPIEKSIAGRLADYYSIKALIHDDFKEYSKMNQSNILALKYAKKEKNYLVAGQACLDLFADIYLIDNDHQAFKYLEMAEDYYKKSDYSNGLLEVNQMYEYAKFLDGDFIGCNNLILKHFDSYKKEKTDRYFYMFALYMLTSNYVYLNDFEKAHKSFKEFKVLETDSTINKYNYYSFEAGINMCFAEVYLEENQMDSTFYYLNKSSKQFEYMGEDVVIDYYSANAKAHKSFGNIDIAQRYLDSILIFEDQMYKNTIKANLQISNSLLHAESSLQEIQEKRFSNLILIMILLGIITILVVFYSIFYRKNKLVLSELTDQSKNLSYLKSNNEKLVVKVQGLEDYINSLKKKLKTIASIDDITNQKTKIKEFYKDLYHNSSTLLDKTENHLALVNDLNVDFFKKIQDLHPQLNNSEIIVCYYLHVGFKNKEIAVFLNTTVRGIESKRYRITKKISLNNTTLLQYLKQTF